jgi:agmatinase
VIAGLHGRPVYLTIDLDVLDPSVFPGTGTPEAGGVTFIELMKAALSVVRGCRVVACDMVELSPPLDASGTSTATALKLLREILLALSTDFIRPPQV